jgi:hypothetical protein
MAGAKTPNAKACNEIICTGIALLRQADHGFGVALRERRETLLKSNLTPRLRTQYEHP